LELGGKDPAYVTAQADLQRAVAGIVDGGMYNAGQVCTILTNLISTINGSQLLLVLLWSNTNSHVVPSSVCMCINHYTKIS
jgi:hypothetical protein